jgi:hypothetical protein
VVHDRQLPALAHVSGVRKALAHHVDQLDTAVHVKALVTVGRKAHVAWPQCHALGDRHRFLAGGLHVKRDAALALNLPHALVEYAIQEHPAQRDLQFSGVKVGVPRALCLVIIVEDSHEAGTQVFNVTGPRVDRRFVDAARRRKVEVTEVRFFTRAGGWVRDMQSRFLIH